MNFRKSSLTLKMKISLSLKSLDYSSRATKLSKASGSSENKKLRNWLSAWDSRRRQQTDSNSRRKRKRRLRGKGLQERLPRLEKLLSSRPPLRKPRTMRPQKKSLRKRRKRRRPSEPPVKKPKNNNQIKNPRRTKRLTIWKSSSSPVSKRKLQHQK